MRLLPALAFSLWLLSGSVAGAAVPSVVVTIKPIHSLVAAVMGELGTPRLIVQGGASPHTYSLRPSDAQAIEAADLVFWTGHGLELFLERALDTLAIDAEVVELADVPGLELLPVRKGGAFEQHADDEEGHTADSHDQALDMHFWLDPVNAAIMADAIAGALAAADPENAATYGANAAALKHDLQALEAELGAILAPIRGASFIVFHDAYQYFERRFDLTVAGSVTVTPDVAPGAQRVRELQDQITAAAAACVFAEPQFEPAIVATILEGTGARSGVLDPEGANLEPGPDLYGALLTQLATGLLECLQDR